MACKITPIPIGPLGSRGRIFKEGTKAISVLPLLSEKLSWGEVTAMVILNEQYEDADFHLGTTHAVSLGRSREPSAHPKIYLAGRQSADSAAFDPDFRALEWCVASRYTVCCFRHTVGHRLDREHPC